MMSANEEYERPLATQLSTARILVAQFEEQLTEWSKMSPNQRKRTVRGRDLTTRLGGLREGLTKWRARAADIEARIAASETAGERG